MQFIIWDSALGKFYCGINITILLLFIYKYPLDMSQYKSVTFDCSKPPLTQPLADATAVKLNKIPSVLVSETF